MTTRSILAIFAVSLLSAPINAGVPTAPAITIHPYADHGDADGNNRDGIVQNGDRWEFEIDTQLPYGLPDGQATYVVDVTLNKQWVALGGVVAPQCPTGNCTTVDVTTTLPNRLVINMTPGPGTGGQYQTHHGKIRFSAVIRGNGSAGDTLDVRVSLLINEHLPIERFPMEATTSTRLTIGQKP